MCPSFRHILCAEVRLVHHYHKGILRSRNDLNNICHTFPVRATSDLNAESRDFPFVIRGNQLSEVVLWKTSQNDIMLTEV